MIQDPGFKTSLEMLNGKSGKTQLS